MKLVIRGNGIYLYRSIRRDGKLTSEYLGSGWLALVRAEEEEEASEQVEAEREAFRAMKAEDERIDRALGELAREAKAAAARELEAAGFYQHDRGRWRRRRAKRDR